MDEDSIRHLLHDVQSGKLKIDEAVERFRHFPYEDLGFARLDHHRELRRGFPEVILGDGKSPDQIKRIITALAPRDSVILVTRVNAAVAQEVTDAVQVPDLTYHQASCCLVRRSSQPKPPNGRGIIAVVSAGTSDLQVAEEAALTAELMRNEVERLYDVGVSGLHRILDAYEQLRRANVLIVVAGMDGVLPSVVSGLVARPVVAVPTSVGYGANLGGLTALFTMLNSCSAGVAVVNIDNGFGAGYTAALMNRMNRE